MNLAIRECIIALWIVFLQARKHLVYICAHKHIPELAPVGTGWHRLNGHYHALRHCLCGPPEKKKHHRLYWLVACHNVIYKKSVVLWYTQNILHNDHSPFTRKYFYMRPSLSLEVEVNLSWSGSLRVCYEASSFWLLLVTLNENILHVYIHPYPTAQPRISINLSTDTFSIIWYCCYYRIPVVP